MGYAPVNPGNGTEQIGDDVGNSPSRTDRLERLLFFGIIIAFGMRYGEFRPIAAPSY